MPDASPKPPPPLRVRLSDLFLLLYRTLAKNTRGYATIARGLIIYKSLSRDTAALHVYKTHDVAIQPQ